MATLVQLEPLILTVPEGADSKTNFTSIVSPGRAAFRILPLPFNLYSTSALFAKSGAAEYWSEKSDEVLSTPNDFIL